MRAIFHVIHVVVLHHNAVIVFSGVEALTGLVRETVVKGESSPASARAGSPRFLRRLLALPGLSQAVSVVLFGGPFWLNYFVDAYPSANGIAL